MVGIALDRSEAVPFEKGTLPHMISKENNIDEDAESISRHSCGDRVPVEEPSSNGITTSEELLDNGCMQFGCPHYRRRCHIRAPCCNEVFDCRHCHNEAKKNVNIEQKHRHDIPRHQIQQVICSLCCTEQEVGKICINCGVYGYRYFCETCKLWEDDRHPRCSFIAMGVIYAESVGGITSSIAINADTASLC